MFWQENSTHIWHSEQGKGESKTSTEIWIKIITRQFSKNLEPKCLCKTENFFFYTEVPTFIFCVWQLTDYQCCYVCMMSSRNFLSDMSIRLEKNTSTNIFSITRNFYNLPLGKVYTLSSGAVGIKMNMHKIV